MLTPSKILSVRPSDREYLWGIGDQNHPITVYSVKTTLASTQVDRNKLPKPYVKFPLEKPLNLKCFDRFSSNFACTLISETSRFGLQMG